MSDKKKLLKSRQNSFLRLLELIDDANEEIKICESLKSDLMVKQAKYIKAKYVKELTQLLVEFEIPIKLQAA